MELKDKEIMQAMSDEEDIMKKLQKVANRDCSFCWQKGENCDGDECEKVIAEKILNIYNRQKAEIERLENAIIALMSYLDILGADKTDTSFINQATEFNKQIRADIKSEAIKEFAERLESKYTKVVSCNAGYVYRTIKKVEKEMVGGENA